MYSVTCIQRPLERSNESGLLQHEVDLGKVVVSEQWFLKAGGLLIQVISSTGLAILHVGTFCRNTPAEGHMTLRVICMSRTHLVRNIHM